MKLLILAIIVLVPLIAAEIVFLYHYTKPQKKYPKNDMLLVKSFIEVVYAVYGDRWTTFSTSKQEDILRMLQYWKEHGELAIHSGPSPEDVIIAIDDAFNAEYGMSYGDILDGPKEWFYVKNRFFMYKILSMKCGLSYSVISRILMKPRTRTAIWHALRKFDDYYKYDADFRASYDTILRLTDNSLKSCQRES